MMKDPAHEPDTSAHVDKYARRWHVTPLGRLIIVVMLVLVGALLVYSIRPVTANDALKRANLQNQAPSDVQRQLTADDAVDFVQASYTNYLTRLGDDGTYVQGSDTPYDLDLMLRRLEIMHGKLGNNLYTNLRAAYNKAGGQGIQRDELLCAPYNFNMFQSSLKQSKDGSAVVTVKRLNGTKPTGSFEATVDLKNSQITALHCL